MRFLATTGSTADPDSLLKGTTLILPTVSIGNVPQAALDLVIATLRLSRIGSVECDLVEPISGPLGLEHLPGKRCLPLEAYQTDDGRFTVIQQRSPILKHLSSEFTDELVDFIKNAKFSRIILVASADADYRNDQQIEGPPVHIFSAHAETLAELTEKLVALKISTVKVVPRIEPTSDGIGGKEGLSEELYHGSGIMPMMYLRCKDEGLPFVVLASFSFDCVDLQNSAKVAEALLELVDIERPGQG
ncbi:hypothetical protein EV182_000781 [Spiromyces aspiralis]|uniref:Uncharacterized protein n=1 Tax=Spiromyces aspiralis TaxID=68401 RepID=A0ACC1HXK4_9FUNG|nr:hypothetical protein EV182_000781 [Spiromyces aspiralis]